MFVSALVNSVNLSGSASLIGQIRARLYPHQVLFFHVPKCAGTSLSHAFRVKYALSYFRLQEEVSLEVVSGEDPDRWMEYKRNLFLYHALTGVRFVQGHIPYDPVSFGPLHGRATFMTVLREPTDRVISHYHFDDRTNSQSFGEFLDSSRGRIECSAYSHFYGGLPFSRDTPGAEHRDAAIAALRRFDVVGLVEEPDHLSRMVKERTGLWLRMPTRNVGATRNKSQSRISDAEMSRLHEMCAFDREIYDAARDIAREG